MKVGDRLSYNGEICTVRYLGRIPAWPDELAIGVEWDDASKGKHSGTYKDVRYFETSVPGSGSFLKTSKKPDELKTFFQAVKETYGTEYTEKEITIGVKRVQSYGFDKLQRLQSDFNYLKNISLSRKCISGHDENDNDAIMERLRNLKELELSFNLFTDLFSILKIASLLDLDGLNLIGNKLDTSSANVVTRIKTLNLTMTYPSNEVLDSLPDSFPQLIELLLSDNRLKSLRVSITNFPSLLHLDISMNDFTEIPKIISQTKITSLNISDNDINITHSLPYSNIKVLDIRRNQISEWSEVDQLVSQFYNVTELRINGNPIFDNKTIEEVEFGVIARWPGLTALNGVKISEQERTNAELYFISKVNEGEIEYDDVKFERLLRKHGKVATRMKPRKECIRNNTIVLNFKYDGSLIKLELLQTSEFLRVRGLISRLIKRSILDFELSYEIGSFKQVIRNDLSLLSSFNFEQGQILTIE